MARSPQPPRPGAHLLLDLAFRAGALRSTGRDRGAHIGRVKAQEQHTRDAPEPTLKRKRRGGDERRPQGHRQMEAHATHKHYPGTRETLTRLTD
jgi:hypothetical protein